MPREPSDNLDDAERLARELAEHSDAEEPTNPVIMNVHNHFDSKHDGEVHVDHADRVELPAQQVVKAFPWAAVSTGVGALVLAGLATLLQHCTH